MILKLAKCSVLAIIALTMNSYGASMAQPKNIQKQGFEKNNATQIALREGCQKRMSSIEERIKFLKECILGLEKGIAKLKNKLPITYPPLSTNEAIAVNAQIEKAKKLEETHKAEIAKLQNELKNIEIKLQEQGLSLQEKPLRLKTSQQTKAKP